MISFVTIQIIHLTAPEWKSPASPQDHHLKKLFRPSVDIAGNLTEAGTQRQLSWPPPPLLEGV